MILCRANIWKAHAQTVMMKNFLRFCELILKSDKLALKKVFLQERTDARTVTDNNLKKIMNLMNKETVFDLKSGEVKHVFKYSPVPDEDFWRITSLHELLKVKGRSIRIDGFSTEEVDEMLEFVCVS